MVWCNMKHKREYNDVLYNQTSNLDVVKQQLEKTDLAKWVAFMIYRLILIFLFIYLFISLKPPKLGKYMYNIWTIST